MATKREVERALAPTGLLAEAAPQFELADSVAKAGVLLALPALLGQGLVEVGQKMHGNLKNGYYGLTSMLLTFGLMALLRIKSTEGLTNHAPGEFGLALGLDRVAEMKTARRKLTELGDRGKAPEFSRAFAERWGLGRDHHPPCWSPLGATCSASLIPIPARIVGSARRITAHSALGPQLSPTAAPRSGSNLPLQ